MKSIKEKLGQIKDKLIVNSGIVFLSLLLIIMVGYKYCENKDSDVNNSNNLMTTYEYDHTIIDNKNEKIEIVKSISNSLRAIRNGSTYVQIQTGDNNYESYMYNRNNECLAQTSDESYYAVFRKDNKTIKYSTENSMIALGTDMDILTFAINAIESVANKPNNKNITLLDMKMTDGNTKEYRVDLNGEEAVKLCYNSLGEDFADNMIDKLKEQLDNEWEPRIVMIYNVSDSSDDVGVSCCYVVDGTEYLGWQLQGYVTVDDWELESKWYTEDFEKLESTELSDMLDSLLDDTDSILDKYISENMETTTAETPNSNSEGNSDKNTGDNNK